MGDFRLMLLIGMGVVLIALLFYFVTMASRKKHYYGQIDELDYFKDELSNKAVPFELAKLRSTKKSERIITLIQQWEKRWSDLEVQFIIMAENINDAEELVAERNFSGVDELLEEMKADLEQLGQQIDELLNEIQMLKVSEERSRSNVVSLKVKFEELKLHFEAHQNKYQIVDREIKEIFKEVEAFFVKFNEYMEECNYDAADETIEWIKDRVEVLDRLFERLPMYQESINQDIRPLLKEVLNSYEYMSQSGIYLKHLQIEETVIVYREWLNEMMKWAQSFEFAKIEKHLLEIHENAKQMLEYMKKEVELQEVVQKELSELQQVIRNLNQEGHALTNRYENIKSNCALSTEDEKNLYILLNELQIVYNEKVFLLSKIDEQKTANSILYRELIQIMNHIEQMQEQLAHFDKEIEKLYAGEKECRYRAMGLLKRFNHLKGQYHQLTLPVENDQLQELLQRGNRGLQALFGTIARVPINISDIDEQLAVTHQLIDEATSYLELETQRIKLAEKLMVYGHRYIGREGMYLVDLTIAEDQFRQGNYQTVIAQMQELLTGIEGSKFDVMYYQFKQELGCHLVD